MKRRNTTLTVTDDRGVFDRGAQFGWQDFFVSAWARVWPDGMELVDDNGVEYVVFSFEKRRVVRQGLKNHSSEIRPKDGSGGIVEVML